MNSLKTILQYKISYLIIGILVGIILLSLFSGGSHDHSSTPSVSNEDTSSSQPAIWTCSMHPQIRQPEPGDCPLCGMDLIPATSADDEDSGPRTLTMSESSKSLAEIQTVSVQRNFVEQELRMVGKVEYDETRIKYITAWFPGRLDRLFVDYTGTTVRKNEHLAEVYSPSIITDQESLIQAKRAVKSLSGSTIDKVLNNRIETLERARERLRLLGLTKKQILEIEESETPSNHMTFYSPIDGIVIHKNALEGDYVQTGTRIYTIADLSSVWVKMDAYESDLQWIHYGQEVEFTVISHPGKLFKGRVSFIDPFLNAKTRTVKVRVNVENPNGELKPEMFVRATVRSKVNANGDVYDSQLAGKWISPMHPEIIKDEPGQCDVCGMDLVKAEELGFVDMNDKAQEPPLVIPSSAPLITGKRAVVYVKIPNTEKPTFQGREIILGPRLKDHYIVHAGLNEGEEVVVKGNFKIDSALQIQAKPSMMSPDGGGSTGGHAHGGEMPEMKTPSKPTIPIPAEVVPALLNAYQSIYEALVQDNLDNAKSSSQEWVSTAKQNDLQEVELLGHEVMHAGDLSEARTAFQKISDLLIQIMDQNGTPEKTMHVIHCPMAFDNQGANWLQWEQETRNPYFGESMLKCGELKRSINPREKLKSLNEVPESTLKVLLEHYKALKDALVKDNFGQVKNAAQKLANEIENTKNEIVKEVINDITKVQNVKEARVAFSKISTLLIDAVMNNNPTESTLYTVHCPMAFNNQGANWLQWSDDIANPYFGEVMLKCGEVNNIISPSHSNNQSPQQDVDHSTHNH